MARQPTAAAIRRPWRRRALRVGRWLGLVTVVALAAVVADAWKALGHRAVGARRARMERSPQWKDGRFANPQPLWTDNWGAAKSMFHASADASPRQPVPADPIDPARFAAPPPSGLRVTWLGHASALIEIDGARVLTDPVWSERASPLGWIGPRRWYRPQIALADLPPIDAVVISHDHYDHLDMRTIVALAGIVGGVARVGNVGGVESTDRPPPIFVVPLGVGAHLAYWGVPESRIVELDWWGRTRVGPIEIVCTPARHASGRNLLFDRDAKLWAGYAFVGARHRAFFSGDTGLHPGLRDIGARLGPFDATMIEVGQYNRAWPDWHIGPEQALVAHSMLRGKVMLPMHWGLFTLAPHGWTEPIERAVAAGRAAGATIVTPRPGESVEPDAPSAVVRWWPTLPWSPASETPIISTQVN